MEVKNVKKRIRHKLSPYEIVARKLRKRVAESSAGEPLGTEVSIARECGVSRMTARKSVNALIAEGLVERRAGIGVFVRQQDTITRTYRLVVGNILWDAAMKVASAIRREAQRSGAEIELRDAGGDVESFVHEIESLPEAGVAGAVVVSIHDPRAVQALKGVSEKGFPLVVVDQDLQAEGVASVVSDDRHGGELAASVLLSEAHREVAFLGDFEASTVQARWEGFRDACIRDGGVEPDRHDIRGVDRLGSWESSIRNKVARLLALGKRPTAFFCSCDAVARLTMRTLVGHGVKVPDDISLVGFDDDPIAEWTTPALTTIRQDYEAIGLAATKLLTVRIQRPADPVPPTVVVPVSLVRRASVRSRA